MKKSYSGLNLLQKKLSAIPEEYKSFLDYFILNRKYLTLCLPYYEYLRGVVFIDDLRDNYGDEVPNSLDISSLIYLLYDDFLTQVKRGVAKNEDVAAYLSKGKEKYFHLPKKEKRVMKALSKNLLQFETIDDDDDEMDERSDDKKAYLEIRVKETEILRAEILIHELSPFLNRTNLNVEEVMGIIYLDFINTLKNEGNSLKVQKSILARIKQ